MALREIAVLVAAAAATAVLTGVVRAHARSRGQLDRPNARSSHTEPTPRGGGLAIVATCVAAALLAAASGVLSPAAAAAFISGGLAVAAVGYVDDRRGLATLPRFAVHVAAALAALALLSTDGADRPFFPSMPPPVVLALLAAGLVWSTNLFNFMDGIDGIAASQGAFVAGAAALLVASNPATESADLTVALATTGASMGFLAWNRPPARIFMGDVGSGFLGFWLAVGAVWYHRTGTLSIWTSTILGSAFIADATVTLLRRMIRGDHWREAHRSHAYQQLAGRWRSHGRVTGLLWLLNLAVAGPLAVLSVRYPEAAPALAGFALVVFGAAALRAGAGRADHPASG